MIGRGDIMAHFNSSEARAAQDKWKMLELQ